MAETVKKAPPVLSGSGENGLTLFKNEDKTKPGSPDLTGFYLQGEKRNYVAAWIVPAGESKGKPYDSFMTLNVNENKAGAGEVAAYETTHRGVLNVVHKNAKGEPVPAEHKTRIVSYLTDVHDAAKKITVYGYATQELVDSPELLKALGVTAEEVNVNSAPKQEAEPKQEARTGPKP